MHYMDLILPVRRKTPINRSINQSKVKDINLTEANNNCCIGKLQREVQRSVCG